MSAIALLTCRNLQSPHGDRYESVPTNLISILVKLGYLPILLPNNFPTKDTVLRTLEILNPRLIVLTGGEDIGANVDRDRTEGYLLDYALEHSDVRILGICRGMQFIAHKFGGDLTRIENHVAIMHSVFDKDRYLGEVNSFHSFQVEKLPSVFNVTSTAQDGSIESFKHRDLPWAACMWHPERMEMPSWMFKTLCLEDDN
jgi:gamma-glutamyl-gamma-aminobutyrate hydrolase PuuD